MVGAVFLARVLKHLGDSLARQRGCFAIHRVQLVGEGLAHVAGDGAVLQVLLVPDKNDEDAFAICLAEALVPLADRLEGRLVGDVEHDQRNLGVAIIL